MQKKKITKRQRLRADRPHSQVMRILQNKDSMHMRIAGAEYMGAPPVYGNAAMPGMPPRLVMTRKGIPFVRVR